MSMVEWDQIACTRGCAEHAERLVEVRLGGPTPYHDLTDIPARFGRTFRMWVWDPDVHPVDGGPYCPARDAVSETIARLGIWEPAETVLALNVMEAAAADQWVLDVGCQVGWYSMLAGTFGLGAIAVDADPEPLRLLAKSARENWPHDSRITTVEWRFGGDDALGTWDALSTEQGITPVHIRLAKFDVEGAEDSAVAAFWPMITQGRIDHMMMEVTPLWAGYYPTLVADLAGVGMVPYLVPDKSQPPVQIDRAADVMEEYRLRGSRDEIKEQVASWRQRDMWFRREDAEW